MAVAKHTFGRAAGWTVFTSAATRGRTLPRDELDVPGVLKPLQLHAAVNHGEDAAKKCLIQDKARKTWAVTARVVIPGILDSPMEARALKGSALTNLLDSCARSEVIDGIALTVRSVPDSPHVRDQIINRYGNDNAPDIVKRISRESDAALTNVGVSPEGFACVIMKESTIAKGARQAGRKDLAGRAMIASQVMSQVESSLLGELGCTEASWLTVDDIAEVMRTAFAPGDAGLLAAARATAPTDTDPITVAPCLAGPGYATSGISSYRHDAWQTTSISILLPAKGVCMGALAPIFTPSQPGEIRHATVFYALTDLQSAHRKAEGNLMVDTAVQAAKDKLGMQATAVERQQRAKNAETEETVAEGFTLLNPVSIVASVTVPTSWDMNQATSRLVSNTRQAGFDCVPLHISHDMGLVASAIPVGIGLHQDHSWIGA